MRALEDRLTASWQARQPIPIETLLAEVPAPHQADVFAALLLVELTFRRYAAAEPITREPYLARFPQFAAQIEAAFREVLADFSLPETVTPNQPAPAHSPPSHSPSSHGTPRHTPDSDSDGERPEPEATVITSGNPGPAAASDLAPPRAPLESIGRFAVLRRLGSGGFGDVYLAIDHDLERRVAIKVPNARALREFGNNWVREARTVAQLKHPHIVPVFEVGSTPEVPAFIVSEYIAGCTLADRLKQSPLPLQQAVQLVIDVADALDYAHRSQAAVVHRDIKPGNLLLDQQERVYVADFGLAIREVDLSEDQPIAGTPAYMSPEQIRREGHRIDGRSDIFSLGVVLYELLTGRRPFKGSSFSEIQRQVTQRDPRPPRQINADVPPELERICLKAIAKQAADRYSTARDLAADLHQLSGAVWGAGRMGAAPGVATPLTPLAAREGTHAPPAPVSPGLGTPGSGSGLEGTPRPAAIVPRGLRSFDRDDAEFFLELLPGARDRDGLPESLRFWKQRIDPSPDGETFAVGLLLGASGCGKSSLVKAGLLPRLSPDVLPIYLEATPDETERQVLAGLVRRLPRLEKTRDLVSALATIRRGEAGLGQRKLLLVLDQFEQWLHAHRGERGAVLTQALRQCDGERLQCLLMVREDFSMAVYRVLQELEIPLVQGKNLAIVDLFDTDHARRVLEKMGRAFGRLPAEPEELDPQQAQFVEGAVRGIAEAHQVVPVRLALFAEMFRKRPWTPGGLIEVGGAEGVGRAFLEETFQSDRAPPQYRLHAAGAQRMLAALLPSLGSDIKGHWRSREELVAAAGYERRPAAAEELLRILDTDLRLVSPVENEEVWREGEEAGEPVSAWGPGEVTTVDADGGQGKNYHLTHDYLVPSLRSWLEELLGRTPEGRAKLLLRERSRVWNAQPLNRHLPTLAEHLQIRRWTKPADRTEPERRMLARAAVVQGRGTVLTVATVLALAVGGWWLQRRQAEREFERGVAAQVAQLETAQPSDWARVRAPLAEPRAREVARRELENVFAAKAPGGRAPTVGERIARLTLGDDRTQLEPLRESLLTGPMLEFLPTRDPLEAYRAELVAPLWRELRNKQGARDRRFRAGMALAAFAPPAALAPVGTAGDITESWTERDIEFLSQAIVDANPGELGTVIEAFRPVASLLVDQFVHFLREFRDKWTNVRAGTHVDIVLAFLERNRELEKRVGPAREFLRLLANDIPKDRLAELLASLDGESFNVFFPTLRSRLDPGVIRRLSVQAQTLPSDDLGSVPRVPFGRDRASAAVALLHLGEWEAALKVCDMTDDPEALTQFMFFCRSCQVPVGTLLACLDRVCATAPGTYPTQVRYALLIALGEYPVGELPAEERERRIEQVAGWYLNDPSSTVHGAAGWLLRRWGATTRAEEVEGTEVKYEPGREWYTEVVEVQPLGEEGGVFGLFPKKPPKQRIAMTFIVFPPGEYDVGAKEDEAGRHDHEHRHRVQLTRPFAVLDREITFAELIAFNPDYSTYMYIHEGEPSTAGAGPNWYGAVEYCRWLGTQQGLSEEEQCYAAPDSPQLKGRKREPNEDWNEYPQAWPVDVSKKGYRLPTEAEWEVAARSLAMVGDRGVVGRTAYGFGSDVELLIRFGCYNSDSLHVGRERLPGLRGLWDMHGNVAEWVHDLAGGWTNELGRGWPQIDGLRVVRGGSWRALGGGSWRALDSGLRCASRGIRSADFEFDDVSFRLVRVPGS